LHGELVLIHDNGKFAKSTFYRFRCSELIDWR
jgi:hypothetical protein